MKRKKIIIIALIVIILITAGILGILYAKTDFFKSDESLFYKYLLKTRLLDTGISQRYTNVVNNMNSSNYSSTGTIGCSMSANDNRTNIANIQNIFSIKYNMLKNKNLQQDYAAFTLSTNNSDIATLKYLRDNEIYALKADNVVDKYLALENKNLKEFFKKLGVEDVSKIPDSIPQNFLKELLDINQEQLNTIKITYANIIKENLTDDNFTKITNANKTKTIELSLTEQKIMDIQKKILETLKEDKDTLNLIIDKANLFEYDWNIDSLRTTIQEAIDQITNGDFSTEPGFLKIAIRENGKDTVGIDCKILVNKKNENESKTPLSFSIDLSETNKVTIYINDGANNHTKLEISFGYEDNSILANVDILELDDANNVKNSIGKIQYQINNYESNTIEQNLVITSISPEDKTKVQISIDNTTQLKEDVAIEKVTNENAAILNNKTSEEINKLIIDIMARIQYLYGEQIANASSYQWKTND